MASRPQRTRSRGRHPGMEPDREPPHPCNRHAFGDTRTWSAPLRFFAKSVGQQRVSTPQELTAISRRTILPAHHFFRLRHQVEQRSPLFPLWSLPQPVFVFGCTILTASAFTTRWMDPEPLVSFLVLAPIPLLLVLERFMPRRQDWLLNWRDLAEDTFGVLATYFIWVLFTTSAMTPRPRMSSRRFVKSPDSPIASRQTQSSVCSLPRWSGFSP